ncbi:MAG: MarR family winged helix-turn-helix transcriptional regulator [Chloroflexota bacterium]
MTHPLRDYIGFQILQIHKAHRNRAESAFNRLGLHTGQEMVLFQLWREEGVTQSQLAGTLCVGPATITKSVKRLEKAGLVQRKQDADDARVSRVYLTPRGRELEAPVRQVWDELEALTVQGLSDEEQARLRRLLQKMEDNLT